MRPIPDQSEDVKKGVITSAIRMPFLPSGSKPGRTFFPAWPRSLTTVGIAKENRLSVCLSVSTPSFLWPAGTIRCTLNK